MSAKKANLLDLMVEGHAYEQGLGRTVDFQAAAMCFQEGARQGSQLAAKRLAQTIAKADLSEEDMKKAASLFQAEAPGFLIQREAKPARRPKVLVIDDGPDTLMVLEYMLRKAGFEPITATDGVDGLEKTLISPDIDCMLIDLQMPNMNGFEFIATLRQQKAFLTTPIIIITAFSDPKLMLQGKKLGVRGWINKPVRKDLVIGTIKRILKVSK